MTLNNPFFKVTLYFDADKRLKIPPLLLSFFITTAAQKQKTQQYKMKNIHKRRRKN